MLVPRAKSDAECSLAPCPLHFLPVLISWPSTQTLAVLDSLYCSISSAPVTFSSGHHKFLIQAADGALQLALLFVGGEKNLQRLWADTPVSL